MQKYFTGENLSISLDRDTAGNLTLHISGDAALNCRKSKLYVNEERLAKDMEEFWKGCTSRKVVGASVGFSEIEHYDNITNIYQTPVVSIGRGARKARIRHCEHGSIPKDWSVEVHAKIKPCSVITPLMDIITRTAGRFIAPDKKKDLEAKLRPVIQGKLTRASYWVEYSEEYKTPARSVGRFITR